MNTIVQIASCVASMCGLVLICVCVGTNNWQETNNEFDDIRRTQGLWKKCFSYSTGNADCDDINSGFLGPPPLLLRHRALSLTSIAVTVLGFVGMLFGVDGVVPINSSIKTAFRIAVGAGWVLGSCFMISAAASYTNMIVRMKQMADDSLALNPIPQPTVGWSLILGWVGAFLLLLGGVLCLVSCCGMKDYTNRPERLRYPMNQYEPRPAAPIKGDQFT